MVYKNSTEILNKLKTKGFQSSTIFTYDFSTLNTTLPHNLIRNQLVCLIENTFRCEEALYLACNEEHAFSLLKNKKYDLWSCQKVTDALIYLMDNIYIRFGSKLYRQNVEIPMGTNCAPLVADLFLFCFERGFMKSLTKEKRYDLIDAFNSTSRYLDDLLNIDNIHFEHMVHRIYPAELQLNKAYASDTEAAFLDLNLSIHNDIVSTKINDKRDDFNFDIVNFPFLDGDVPQRPSGVNISQLIRFARASSHATDFNNLNKFLTAKLLKQGYRYHKLRKAFSKCYRRHCELIEKYHIGQKKLMQQRICNPEFYGDLIYKFKKIIGNPNFSYILNRFKRAGYSLDIMRQTACLVFNPIMVEGYAALFSCTAVVQASDSMTASM